MTKTTTYAFGYASIGSAFGVLYFLANYQLAFAFLFAVAAGVLGHQAFKGLDEMKKKKPLKTTDFSE